MTNEEIEYFIQCRELETSRSAEWADDAVRLARQVLALRAAAVDAINRLNKHHANLPEHCGNERSYWLAVEDILYTAIEDKGESTK